MKKFIGTHQLLILFFLLYCSVKESKENSEQQWKELESLKLTMEKAFRPLKDSSSVAQVAKLMAQIADETEKLTASPLPRKMDNAQMRKKLEKLKLETRSLANEIKTGTEDDVIGTDFYSIHQLFLEIQDVWEK